MDYLLVIVMSSATFLPGSFTVTPFPTKESCEAALSRAKKEWQTVNNKSECVDLKKQKEIQDLQDKLDKAKE